MDFFENGFDGPTLSHWLQSVYLTASIEERPLIAKEIAIYFNNLDNQSIDGKGVLELLFLNLGVWSFRVFIQTLEKETRRVLVQNFFESENLVNYLRDENYRTVEFLLESLEGYCVDDVLLRFVKTCLGQYKQSSNSSFSIILCCIFSSKAIMNYATLQTKREMFSLFYNADLEFFSSVLIVILEQDSSVLKSLFGEEELRVLFIDLALARGRNITDVFILFFPYTSKEDKALFIDLVVRRGNLFGLEGLLSRLVEIVQGAGKEKRYQDPNGYIILQDIKYIFEKLHALLDSIFNDPIVLDLLHRKVDGLGIKPDYERYSGNISLAEVIAQLLKAFAAFSMLASDPDLHELIKEQMEVNGFNQDDLSYLFSIRMRIDMLYAIKEFVSEDQLQFMNAFREN